MNISFSRNRKSKNYFILLLIFICFDNIWGQTYEYPVPQHGEHLRALSAEERHQLFQIPEGLLPTLSTKELIRLYVENDQYCGLIYAYNNKQDGFNRIYELFNGLRELMKRDDLTKSALAYYQEMDPNALIPSKTSDPWERGLFFSKFDYIELLLSQEKLIEQLSQEESINLLEELLKKHDQIISSGYSSGVILSFTIYAMANLIDHKNKDNNIAQQLNQIPRIKDFIEGHRVDLNQMKQIVDIVRIAVKNR